MLYDNHGRPLRYLRLAITDRCNLRCFYCMPEHGIQFSPKKEVLSFEEMERLVGILVEMGITKVRITGGEPFVRKNLMDFLGRLSQMQGLEQINITSNGTYLAEHVPALMDMGIHSVNLSLDSLNPQRFFEITRRDVFDTVWSAYEALMKHGMKTKINAVVMEEHNLADIIPFSALTEKDKVAVRFIEEMPFNGGSKGYVPIKWNAKRILEEVRTAYPTLEKIEDGVSSTSHNYRVPGFAGSIGVIPAYTRTICGTCDRIRMTPKGSLKTCLYDDGVFNFRDFIRSGATDEDIRKQFLKAFGNRAKDGFEAESRKNTEASSFESMATIGG
ncbi:MAG: GTP 3',8-cyclase MoaA [Bacteroidota bacterium]